MQAVIKQDSGDVLQVFTFEAKDFKTGSRGFHAQGKLPVNGKKYQCNLMLIEIGSKPKVKGKK